MSMFDDLADQANNLAQDHAGDLQNAADQAAQQVGGSIDEATGGKFTEQIQQAQSQAGDQVGQLLRDNAGADASAGSDAATADGVEADGAQPTAADADPFGDASGVTEGDVDAAFDAD